MKIGDTFQSRTKTSTFKVHSLRFNKADVHIGYNIEKSSGKLQAVSLKAIKAVEARIDAGERPCFQANAPQGGISYTVAVEATIVFALGLTADNSTKTWRR